MKYSTTDGRDWILADNRVSSNTHYFTWPRFYAYCPCCGRRREAEDWYCPCCRANLEAPVLITASTG